MVLYLIPILTGSVYGCLLFFLVLGAQRLYQKQKSRTQDLPSISVIVPLRNEELSAEATLNALKNQNYQGLWEVICVNDRSTDKTAQILDNFCQAEQNFRCIHISNSEPNVPSPKKRALARGFKMATGEILMTTDADCIPPPHWLHSMAINFTTNIAVVQGPKEIIGPNNLITRYQKLEVFGYVSIEAATFAMGQPLIASAPSLAYKRELYEKVGGFDGMEHLVSGDDDMLVDKMRSQENAKVRYNLDSTATVKTPGVENWKSLIVQRARWASNGAQYENKWFVLLLVSVFIFYCYLCLSPFLYFFSLISWQGFILPWAFKYASSYFFLSQTAIKFRKKRLLLDLWWVEPLHVPITVLAATMGQLGWYRWKD